MSLNSPARSPSKRGTREEKKTVPNPPHNGCQATFSKNKTRPPACTRKIRLWVGVLAHSPGVILLLSCVSHRGEKATSADSISGLSFSLGGAVCHNFLSGFGCGSSYQTGAARTRRDLTAPFELMREVYYAPFFLSRA